MGKHNIALIEKCRNNGYADYDLYEGDEMVGLLQTIEDERDFVFIRQIEIFDKYQGEGRAASIVDDFIISHNKSMRFCIAMNSRKAILFWRYYLANTKFNKKNLRGEIWEVWK